MNCKAIRFWQATLWLAVFSLVGGKSSFAGQGSTVPPAASEYVLLLHWADGAVRDGSRFASSVEAGPGITYAERRSGKALAWDGQGWLTVAENPEARNLDFAGPDGRMTLDLWLKPEGHSPRGVVLARRGTGASWSFSLVEGRPVFSHYAPGRWASVVAEYDPLPLQAWTHLAVTVDSTDLLVSFFFNGKLVHRDDLAAPLAYSRLGELLWIGGTDTNPVRYRGLMEGLRIRRGIRYDQDGVAAVGEPVFPVAAPP